MTGQNSRPHHILVDWGTSNARAWLLDGDGRILDHRSRPIGIRQVEDSDFGMALDSMLAEWAYHEATPVLMSGMIGSRQGWHETPYVPCPASIDDLFSGIQAIPDRPNVRITPGINDGTSDVMRGEEVQIFGAVSMLDRTDKNRIFCLPGTHSKWAEVEDGRLRRFATAMTGEAYAAFADHTILGAMMPDRVNRDDGRSGFSQGLAQSREPGGLLHHVFSVRSLALFEQIDPEDLRGYLSGILIGHEICDMLKLFGNPAEVIVVGEAALAQIYIEAITNSGSQASMIDAEKATLAGLSRLAELPHEQSTEKQG